MDVPLWLWVPGKSPPLCCCPLLQGKCEHNPAKRGILRPLEPKAVWAEMPAVHSSCWGGRDAQHLKALGIHWKLGSGAPPSPMGRKSLVPWEAETGLSAPLAGNRGEAPAETPSGTQERAPCRGGPRRLSLFYLVLQEQSPQTWLLWELCHKTNLFSLSDSNINYRVKGHQRGKEKDKGIHSGPHSKRHTNKSGHTPNLTMQS